MYKPIISLLLLITITIWIAVLTYPDEKLHLIACDVGQGDAILITYKDVQILTDGGPNKKVLDCLARHMPFWDRTIEVVILTNPDLDHYGGLMDVIKNYNVKNYFESPVPDSTQQFKVLEELLGSKGIHPIHPNVGQRIGYGLMYLDIVYPNLSENYAFPSPQNNYSTVTKLTFGNFEAILTGDIQEEASDYIANNIDLGDVDYIKIAHHGSRHGTTKSFLERFQPEIAVISAGKTNRYGHPHPEILGFLNELNIKILRTELNGDVEFITNGKEIVNVSR